MNCTFRRRIIAEQERKFRFARTDYVHPLLLIGTVGCTVLAITVSANNLDNDFRKPTSSEAIRTSKSNPVVAGRVSTSIPDATSLTMSLKPTPSPVNRPSQLSERGSVTVENERGGSGPRFSMKDFYTTVIGAFALCFACTAAGQKLAVANDELRRVFESQSVSTAEVSKQPNTVL